MRLTLLFVLTVSRACRLIRRDQYMKLNEVKVLGSRSSFVETWLTEMPSGLGRFDTYEALVYSIKDFLKHGINPALKEPLYKIDAGDKLFYWIGPNIDIATEVHVKPEGLVVSITGKNPTLRGNPPFASDLYSLILKESEKNIKLLSDDQLSDEGFSMWKNMVKLGAKVSVYDARNPGKTFKTIDDPSELEDFFKHDDSDFRQYRFVLSENLISFLSMRSSFRLRLLRESTPGMALTDYV